ncbi:transglutaminase family protein [Spiribacter sp. C176]|uniref:Transglutaminase family protein n=1 Tax=Spiribacter salilacus TaxID=2664894 RepID=A0A6N7QU51_9GAMM|nr:transglutaminase family protein [Spiribacter salilacus]
MIQIIVDISELQVGDVLLAPVGTTTPQHQVERLQVNGVRVVEMLREPTLELAAVRLEATAEQAQLTYTINESRAGSVYPEAAFRPSHNVYTQPAVELAEHSREVVARAGGGYAGIAALVAEAESRFAYAHPDVRFTDGLDQVPYLSCGTTPGSCIDINTYLMASLHSAGYEAGYFFGYFFPAENNGRARDHHCWVVTRCQGEVIEWDIAHHLKAGLGPTQPGLNPRPGWRVALGHTMGHVYPTALGEASVRLLAEPHRITAEGHCERVVVGIQALDTSRQRA